MCPVSLSPLSSCLTACAQATLLASSYIHPTHHTLTIVLVNAASTDESVTVVVPTPSVELFQTAVSSDNHLWQVSLYLYTYIYLCVCVCVCVCVVSYGAQFTPCHVAGVERRRGRRQSHYCRSGLRSGDADRRPDRRPQIPDKMN